MTGLVTKKSHSFKKINISIKSVFGKIIHSKKIQISILVKSFFKKNLPKKIIFRV